MKTAVALILCLVVAAHGVDLGLIDPVCVQSVTTLQLESMDVRTVRDVDSGDISGYKLVSDPVPLDSAGRPSLLRIPGWDNVLATIPDLQAAAINLGYSGWDQVRAVGQEAMTQVISVVLVRKYCLLLYGPTPAATDAAQHLLQQLNPVTRGDK